MSLLFVGAAVRCFTAPLSGPGTPTAWAVAVGIACLVVASLCFLGGESLPPRGGYLLLVGITAVTTFLVATSRSRGDVTLSAFAYPWGGLYAAHFLSRRAAHAYAAMASASFAAAIVVTGSPRMLATWVFVSITLVAVTTITASLVEALRRQSETDALTGIANRAGFARLADHLLTTAERTERPVSLVLCDVDGLKEVNDALGHAAGDVLLTTTVQAWRSALRGCDVLARMGGDEFAVLLPDTDAAGANAVVVRMHAATATGFAAGVATWTAGDSVDAMLARADTAMYRRKHAMRRMLPRPRTAVARVSP